MYLGIFDSVGKSALSTESYEMSVFLSVFSLVFFFSSILVFPVTNSYLVKGTNSSLPHAGPYVLTWHWRAC